MLRQISVLAEFGEVTTIGYGMPPEGAKEHIEVPSNLPSLPQTVGGVARLALRRWRSAELDAPAIRFCIEALRGQQFDLVVANEARVLALADHVAEGAPIWADLHEWAPEERTQVLSWRLLVAPLMRHLCARYLRNCAATSTVSGSIAELYSRDFGVRPAVVRNANPWRDLRPSAVDDDRVRLVHSGGAVRGRNIEAMIDAVRQLDERFTLDLYLVPASDGGRYQRELQARAAGCARITFHPPVAPHELPETLNAFDAGVYIMPPTTTNARLALPNKFFDFVQGRLAVIVGPTAEMANLVEQHGLGLVAADFSPDATVATLKSLNAEQLRAFKLAADRAARELSFEADAEVVRQLVRGVLDAA